MMLLPSLPRKEARNKHIVHGNSIYKPHIVYIWNSQDFVVLVSANWFLILAECRIGTGINFYISDYFICPVVNLPCLLLYLWYNFQSFTIIYTILDDVIFQTAVSRIKYTGTALDGAYNFRSCDKSPVFLTVLQVCNKNIYQTSIYIILYIESSVSLNSSTSMQVTVHNFLSSNLR